MGADGGVVHHYFKKGVELNPTELKEALALTKWLGVTCEYFHLDDYYYSECKKVLEEKAPVWYEEGTHLFDQVSLNDLLAYAEACKLEEDPAILSYLNLTVQELLEESLPTKPSYDTLDALRDYGNRKAHYGEVSYTYHNIAYLVDSIVKHQEEFKASRFYDHTLLELLTYISKIFKHGDYTEAWT
jgi:hypothetical protein